MRRFAVPAVIAAVAVVLLIVLAVGISGQGSNSSLEYGVQSHQYKAAPDASAQLPVLGNSATGAKKISLSNFRGKLVLINMFASWCVPCQDEAPVLAKAQKVLAAHGGTILGVSYQDAPQDALSFIAKYHVDYPTVSDPAGDFANAYNVSGVPDSFLVNGQGKVVWVNLYQLTPSFVTKTLPGLVAKFA